MATPLESSTSSNHSERVLRELEAESKREASERTTGWTVVWTLFVFKMATITIIWFAAHGTPEANAYITVTTWYWLGIPVFAASGFVAYRLRLRRARKQADRLRKSEFMEDEPTPEIFVMTDEEVRKLIELEARHNARKRPGEG